MGGRRWVTENTRDLAREHRRSVKYDPTYKEATRDLPPLPARSECRDGPRPCPHVRCRYHLMVDVTSTGSLRLYGTEPSAMKNTCALDVADKGPVSLGRAAELLGLTPERVRQCEEAAIYNLSDALAADGMDPDEVRQIMERNAAAQIGANDVYGFVRGECLDSGEMLRVARACVKRLDDLAGYVRKKRLGHGERC